MPLQGSDRDLKRRRIAIACNECRDRKRKCDGVRPVCGSCAKRSSPDCVWEEGRSAKGWSNSYVESLRCRIQELENSRQAIADTPSVAISSTKSANQDDPEITPEVSALGFVEEESDGSGVPTHHQQFVPSEAVDISKANSHVLSTNKTTYVSAAMGFQDAKGPASLDNRTPMEGYEGDDESAIDAMGVFGSVGRRESQGPDFFGPSSTLSFLCQARRAMSRSEVSPNCDRQKNAMLDFFQDEAISVGEKSRSPSFEASKNRFSLAGHRLIIPPRNQADALLESYWIKFHSLYPFLHRQSFTKKYLTLWTPSFTYHSAQIPQSQRDRGFYDGLDDILFHCLLNLVFALGSQFDTIGEGGDRSELGSAFFGRAKALIDFDMLAQGNIYLVQILILMGQYLQSTDMTSACWNIVGLAIRVAQGIGLHHEPEYCDQGCCSKGNLNQVETEMRRRAWTGCMILDRVLSMTYGRPLMIQPVVSKGSAAPSAIDDEFLSQDPTTPAAQPQDVPSLTECYVQSIKLQNIIGEVLWTLYYGSGNKGNGKLDININLIGASMGNDKLKSGDIQILLNIDKSLCAWSQNLPAWLKPQNYNPRTLANESFGRRTAKFYRQATILHARYLHVRLIMFRPVLSALLHLSSGGPHSEPDNSMESVMHQSMLEQGVNLCVSSACDLVELITDNLEIYNDILPPPWHNVFYIHSCAIVFLICLLCCLDRIERKGTLVASWNKCLEFFRAYRLQSRSARRCLRLFEAVQAKIFPSQTDEHPANHSGPTLDNVSARHDVPANLNWGQNSPLLHENSQKSFDNAIFSDEGTANWINDPSEINWLSVFPFVEGFKDGVPF